MSTRDSSTTARRPLAALLAAVILIGLGIAVLVLNQSSLDLRSSDAAAVDREFDAVRRRFADKPPYVTVVRDGQLATHVRHELEPVTPARIELVKGIAWHPASGRRVSASTPYWVFLATRWKAKTLGAIVRPFHQQLGLEVDLPDLAPLGRGLVLDERYPDRRRVIVWTE